MAKEVEAISNAPESFGSEWSKLAPLVLGLQELSDRRPSIPVRIGRGEKVGVVAGLGDRSTEVLQLAADLVRIPSVTNCADERIDQVFSCAGFVANQLSCPGLDVRFFDRGRYPAVLASFAAAEPASITLCGHFDVVRPEPDDSQFEPRIQGDYLLGPRRGRYEDGGRQLYRVDASDRCIRAALPSVQSAAGRQRGER